MPDLYIFLLMALMHALFALTFPIGKFGLMYTNALFLTGLRMTLAGACFMVWQYSMHRSSGLHNRRTALRIVYLTVWYIVLAYVPEFWALGHLTSFKTNMLWSMQPFLAALVDRIVYRQHLSVGQYIALVLGLCALVPLFVAGSDDALSLLTGSSLTPLPELALVVAVVSTLYGWMLIKDLTAQGLSLVTLNAYSMSLGGLVCLVAGAGVALGQEEVLVASWMPVLGASALLVGISNIAGYMIYGYLLNHASLTLLSFSGFLCPVWGLMFGALMGEPITATQVISLVGVIGALGLYYYSSSPFGKLLKNKP